MTHGVIENARVTLYQMKITYGNALIKLFSGAFLLREKGGNDVWRSSKQGEVKVLWMLINLFLPMKTVLLTTKLPMKNEVMPIGTIDDEETSKRV